MLKERLKQYNVILGSASPRRKTLLTELGISFTIKTTKEKEYYPELLNGSEIAEFIAKQKASYISKQLQGKFLLITADTIVLQKNKILHKPKNKENGKKILQKLSGEKHKVISGVCLKTNKKELTFSSETEVLFNKLSNEEIMYYLETFNPFDKAGSYGIQDWIGHIGIEEINGSYNNVVGLPTSQLYQKLKLFI